MLPKSNELLGTSRPFASNGKSVCASLNGGDSAESLELQHPLDLEVGDENESSPTSDIRAISVDELSP